MALQFNGTTQRLDRSSCPVGTAVPCTIACWANHSDGNSGTLMNFEKSTDANNVIGLQIDNSHHPVMYAGDSGITGTTDAAISETNGQWNHYCMVMVANNDRRLFYNGAASVTSAVARAPTGLNTMQCAVRANAAGGGAIVFLNGALAHVCCWNVALDAAECAAIGKGYDPRLIRPASLQFYLPFSRGSVLVSSTTLDRWNGRLDFTEANTPTFVDNPKFIDGDSGHGATG